MIIDIAPELYENITEIYSTGNNTLEVVTRNDRRIKVQAGYRIRGNNHGTYSAIYEELVEIEHDLGLTEVWKKPVDIAWVQNDTIEGCLRQALGYIDDAGA